MRAIVVTCPQCGANLRVDDSLAAVTCQYCGTEARIQQRSRVFQVPRPMAGPSHVPVVPVARQRVHKGIYVWLAVMAVFIGGSIAMSSRVKRAAERVAHDAVNAGKDRMDWNGGAPVLGDVDGDGADDVIGFVHYILDGDHAHVAAFSGKTGARLWQTESLGAASTVSQAMLAAAGDTIYYATDDGVLHARELKTGTARWSTSLGEKTDGLCAGAAPGEIAVETADDKWWIVDGTGAKRPGPALVRFDSGGSKPDDLVARFASVGPEGLPGVCMEIDNRAWQRPVQLLTIDNWSTLPKVDGMYVERLVRRPGGPIVAVGYKQPGTAVPMLARVDGEQVRWTTEIPSSDPLTSSSDDKIAGMSAEAIFVEYEPRASSGPTRLAAFDLADGHRRWERDLRQGTGSLNVASVIVVGDVVIAASWSVLQALDQKDGTPRFTIGTF